MPTNIGRFEVLAEISHSDAVSVCKVCDSAGGQVVALKSVDLSQLPGQSPLMIKRILEEAETSKLLNTHNIAMLFGAGEIDGRFCATMEYVQGNSIETMLERKEVFSIWDIQDIARQTCQGLDHARVNKVVHYSLEPGKVMVQWDGVVKMLGFGVSMMGVFLAQNTSGTPKILNYMSPEQLEGNPIDSRSNLFSAGAIFYEMLTQRKAFDGENAEQVRQAVMNVSPTSPCEINSKIDAGLSEVIMKVLSKSPEDRYQSGQDLINDLEKCKNNPVKAASSNKSVAAATGKSSGSKKTIPTPPAQSAPLTSDKPGTGQAQGVASQEKNSKAAAAAAGASSSGSSALQALKDKKLDPSSTFITSCIKASIDAVINVDPKMSSATMEPEVKAPKIAVDPMMDESRAAAAKKGPSFSEIEELPPLKEIYTAPAPAADMEEDVLEDHPAPLPASRSAQTPKQALPAKEMAKKAVKEIKKTPPKMFAYSIGAAVAIIVLIGGSIALRVHRDGVDDEKPAAVAPIPSPQANAGDIANGSDSAVNHPVQVNPVGGSENSEPSRTARAKNAARKKGKPSLPTEPVPMVIPAQMMINSNPEGAQVQIDGHSDPSWVTPYNITGLAPGQHTVYLSKAGFSPEIRTVDALSGSKSTVMVHFNELPATAFIVSAPAGASIVIDGKDSGRVTPSQISIDKMGNHVFLVAKQGYLDETTSANLVPGQVFHYSPTLTPLGSTEEIKTVGKFKKLFGGNDTTAVGIVSAKIQPKGAQIVINGRLLEKSAPVDFYLNPGTYLIDVTLTGYKSVRHVITVNRGGKIMLDDTLQPQ